MTAQPGIPAEWPATDGGTLPPEEKAKLVFTAEVDVVAAEYKAAQARNNETHKDALSQVSARLAEDAAEVRAESDGFREASAAERAADLANLSNFFESASTLALGAVDRGRSGAEVVQKASAAIVTLYTAILAFVYAAGDNPLPTRGVLAPVFLGLAVVLSTAYLGYVTPSKEIAAGPAAVAGVESKAYARLNTLTAISSTIATRRSYLLRSGVLALGVGLLLIVLPFVSLGTSVPATAEVTVPEWPTPRTGIPDALNAIVYQAQVAEVAAARASGAEAATGVEVDDTGLLVVIGALGLLVTFGVPAIWSDRRRG